MNHNSTCLHASSNPLISHACCVSVRAGGGCRTGGVGRVALALRARVKRGAIAAFFGVARIDARPRPARVRGCAAAVAAPRRGVRRRAAAPRRGRHVGRSRVVRGVGARAPVPIPPRRHGAASDGRGPPLGRLPRAGGAVAIDGPEYVALFST